ncbi:unnamed protein product [Fraxinus pennsylvanica]|uniref:Uncharacterized protein n=1 Tax=Fraxinus pennsylvanica TaxID=56036 RepID=A0AAD1Z9K2_9LAMI|nr:unnamed protein product [Fraxinus pennsylvanica]
MAFHVRSNSFPSKSHPAISNVEDHLCRLKSSKEASVSSSSICTELASLRDLHENINNLIQLPSVQQALADETFASELLDGSLKLVDICGIARDVIVLMKESVQELQSSLRRNRGTDAYMTSRKNIDKMVNKCIKNLKSFEQSSTNKHNNLKGIATVLKESQVIGFSALKSAMTICASKQKTWSLLSKFTQSSRVHSETEEESNAQEFYALNIDKLRKDMHNVSVQDIMKQLKASEMTIQELEENLEAFFRSSVKIRVSLLNASSEASVSASSKCIKLASLRDLHEVINNLIQHPSVQQSLIDQASELLDGSLELVDLCGIAQDVILLTKESVEELKSSLRRNRGIETYIN